MRRRRNFEKAVPPLKNAAEVPVKQTITGERECIRKG